MKTRQHIVVIRLSAMGDVAMMVPVLQVLAQTYPNLMITVVSRGFFKPMFEGLSHVNFYEADVYGKHKGGIGLWRLANELFALNVDAVADLHNVIRSNVLTSFLWLKGVFSVKIDKGRKEKAQLLQSNGTAIKPLKSTHERYAEVFEKLGFPMDLNTWKKPKRPEVHAVCKNFLEGPDVKKIGIAPYAAFPSKVYPAELMEEVVRMLDARRNLQILLFGGGKKETDQLTSLAQRHKNVKNLAGRLSFSEELNIMAQLDVMVSMDSGNGHLAAMLGVPVVTLWGVTHPYAGFVPFYQPMENQLLADRERFPLIPTSIYGNKFPKDYEKAIATIEPISIYKKILELLD